MKIDGLDIHYLEEVTSTNDVAKELAKAGAPSKKLVVSDYQSAGKGRRGRTWLAPMGQDIFMSLILRPEIAQGKASMLTLVMGLSVAEAIRSELGIEAMIKWPNDIVVDGQKVCGILTEMSAVSEDGYYVVIGTGINCNSHDFDDEELSYATSLMMVSSKEVNREELIAAVMKSFDKNLDTFLKKGNLSELGEAYNHILVNKDSEVQICENEKTWTAIALGINDDGGLLVEDSEGNVHTIFTGEVSVRGLNGYV